MVKVKYDGNMSSGVVKVLGNRYHFEKGQILEMDEKSAKQLTLNKEYILVEDKPAKIFKKKAKKEIEEEEDSELEEDKEW